MYIYIDGNRHTNILLISQKYQKVRSSASTSKSSLPEATTTSPSLHIISDTLKIENCLAMKHNISLY